MTLAGYPYISVWGEILGSAQYYIRQEQSRAETDGAPLSAIYEKHGPGGTHSGIWVIAEEIVNQGTRERFARLCETRGLPIPMWKEDRS